MPPARVSGGALQVQAPQQIAAPRHPVLNFLLATWLGNIIAVIALIFTVFAAAWGTYTGVLGVRYGALGAQYGALQSCASLYSIGKFSAYCNTTLEAGVTPAPVVRRHTKDFGSGSNDLLWSNATSESTQTFSNIAYSFEFMPIDADDGRSALARWFEPGDINIYADTFATGQISMPLRSTLAQFCIMVALTLGAGVFAVVYTRPRMRVFAPIISSVRTLPTTVISLVEPVKRYQMVPIPWTERYTIRLAMAEDSDDTVQDLVIKPTRPDLIGIFNGEDGLDPVIMMTDSEALLLTQDQDFEGYTTPSDPDNLMSDYMLQESTSDVFVPERKTQVYGRLHGRTAPFKRQMSGFDPFSLEDPERRVLEGIEFATSPNFPIDILESDLEDTTLLRASDKLQGKDREIDQLRYWLNGRGQQAGELFMRIVEEQKGRKAAEGRCEKLRIDVVWLRLAYDEATRKAAELEWKLFQGVPETVKENPDSEEALAEPQEGSAVVAGEKDAVAPLKGSPGLRGIMNKIVDFGSTRSRDPRTAAGLEIAGRRIAALEYKLMWSEKEVKEMWQDYPIMHAQRDAIRRDFDVQEQKLDELEEEKRELLEKVEIGNANIRRLKDEAVEREREWNESFDRIEAARPEWMDKAARLEEEIEGLEGKYERLKGKFARLKTCNENGCVAYAKLVAYSRGEHEARMKAEAKLMELGDEGTFGASCSDMDSVAEGGEVLDLFGEASAEESGGSVEGLGTD
ncbi:hypothetical protein B0A54_17452 [Friedmanniomyces endolithicus]|uniref:Uncharacterized protein n=1 Tax=Friedmanniomyces endolithicus TaxID=329885 RepID=A0A4U0TSC1_9PEZI|nr:hypothetical protein B0A54_17452 [Friedmanniomyces endolithicus]